MSDEFDLLERWQRGDLDAANELLGRYYPVLRRFFAAKLSDEAAREELIQDTFVALLPAIQRFERRASAKAFVLGIARNKLHDHLRGRYRSGGSFDPLRDSVEDVLGKSPSSHAAMLERNQGLLAAIAALPVDERIMLELDYWHDMSSSEIAAIFKLTPEAVRARLFRARKTLQHLLGAASGEVVEPDPIDARMRELGLEFD